MGFQTVFKRYELKYMLTAEQKKKVLSAMENHMSPDQYGRVTIRNVYFDTDNYRLIRRSIEKPAYKEKLRIRSYCHADPDSDVFVELKKKYKNVVYKRRLSMPEEAAMRWVCGEHLHCMHNQISEEVDYFISPLIHSYVVPFRNCGHMLHEEKFEKFNNTVLEFLNWNGR